LSYEWIVVSFMEYQVNEKDIIETSNIVARTNIMQSQVNRKTTLQPYIQNVFDLNLKL
jgi:hypothetical protein